MLELDLTKRLCWMSLVSFAMMMEQLMISPSLRMNSKADLISAALSGKFILISCRKVSWVSRDAFTFTEWLNFCKYSDYRQLSGKKLTKEVLKSSRDLYTTLLSSPLELIRPKVYAIYLVSSSFMTATWLFSSWILALRFLIRFAPNRAFFLSLRRLTANFSALID